MKFTIDLANLPEEARQAFGKARKPFDRLAALVL